MADSTNKTPSQETQDKLYGGFGYDQSLGDNQFPLGPIPEYSQIMGGFNLTAYSMPDGSNGWALYNGKMAFHLGADGNMTFSAGAPGQSGCGGKMVLNSQSQLQKAESIAIEVTGRPDGGTVEKTADTDGNVEEKNLPSYSLKVYGPVNIEALGGDCAVKGDNVLVSANSTLNLKSNKDINIQAGENGGKINLLSGVLNIDAAFVNKNISGGDYTTGAGEVKVEQNKAGSEVSIETPGSVRYIVNGDYTVGVKGKYTTDVTGKYTVNVDKDYKSLILGDYSHVVSGKAHTKINGVGSKSKQQQNWLIDVLPNEQKTSAGFEVDSSSLIKFTNKIGGFKWEVGKQLASMELTDKNKFSVTTGAKLGAITIDERQAIIEHGKYAKLSLTPTETKLEAVTAALSLNQTESKLSNTDAAYVSVKPADVTIVGPLIYLN